MIPTTRSGPDPMNQPRLDIQRRLVAGSLAATLLVGILSLGCGSRSKSKPRPTPMPSANGASSRAGISELHLFGNPVAMNLDGIPGPDGIGVRIFASSSGKAKGVAISQGTLEILMFDGVPNAAITNSLVPSKIWSFNPTDLRAYMADTSLGTGYQFALPWGEQRPTQSRVTVVARLTLPKGQVLSSDSSSISVAVK